MLTQSGWVRGVEAVVSGTLETLNQFPTGGSTGEDVVWADHGRRAACCPPTGS